MLNNFSNCKIFLIKTARIFYLGPDTPVGQKIQIFLSVKQYYFLWNLLKKRKKDRDGSEGGWVSKNNVTITPEDDRRLAMEEITPEEYGQMEGVFWRRDRLSDNLNKLRDKLLNHGIAPSLIESGRGCIRISPEVRSENIVLGPLSEGWMEAS